MVAQGNDRWMGTWRSVASSRLRRRRAESKALLATVGLFMALSGRAAMAQCDNDGACEPPAEDPCNCQDCGLATGSEVGLCTDGIDNDCDTFIDCGDSDCNGDPACPTTLKCMNPGQDCFSTACNGNTSYDFSLSPAPAGYVCPTQTLPFEGVVILGGLSGGTDTVVQRQGQICHNDSALPDTTTVPIELVQLNLKSCAPITVPGCPGTWDVYVGIPPTPPQPQGLMTVTKVDPIGGTYTATLPVNAEVRFAPSGSPPPATTPLTASTVLNTTCASSWLQFCSPFECSDPCGNGGFSAGWDIDQNNRKCCRETCHANPAGGHEHCTIPPKCQPCPTAGKPEDCNDEIDNDGDGLCDCADPDCELVPKCNPYKNWVIADDFMIGCADCTCDLNRDGVCNQVDSDITHDCQAGIARPECPNADLDCDGDVDNIDDGAWYCMLNGGTAAECCPGGTQICENCTCDLNRDGVCNALDDDITHGCQFNPAYSPFCGNADMNCDGVVDGVDDTAWYCMLTGGTPDKCCPNNRPRPRINRIRWYGSYLDPSFDPLLGGTRQPDGWYVALHSDLPAQACPPIPAGPGGGTSKAPVDLCGTLINGVESGCVMFQPDGSTNLYNVQGGYASTAPYGKNDKLRICGYIDNSLPTTCQQGIGNIVVNSVSDCDTKVSRPDKLIGQWAFQDFDILREQTGKTGWDGHPIYCYTVDIPKGCLVHNNAGFDEIPNPNGAFFPRNNRTYWLSIQAEVGAVWTKIGPGQCHEDKTGNAITQPFWGWHTTPPGYQQKDDAYMGQVEMECCTIQGTCVAGTCTSGAVGRPCTTNAQCTIVNCDEWLYEWMNHLHCSDNAAYRDCCDDPTKSIDMAFYLLQARRGVCGTSNIECLVSADCPAGYTCNPRPDVTWWCQPVNGGPPSPDDNITPLPRPYPVGGIDELTNTSAEVTVNIPGQPTQTLQLSGPTVVARTGRLQVQPQPEPPLPQFIEAEMLMLDLRSSDGKILRLNPDAPPSKGQTLAGPGGRPSPYPSQSFFDVFVEIELPPTPGLQGECFGQSCGVTQNCFIDADCPLGCRCKRIFISGNPAGTGPGPVRLDSQIYEIPPGPTPYHSSGAVPLLRKRSLQPVGSIKNVGHDPPYRGGFNIHSDTDWVNIPDDPCCEPDADSPTLCTQTDCPNVADNERCLPKEGGACSPPPCAPPALSCECQKEDFCHLTYLAAVGDWRCVNPCPDPTKECRRLGSGTATDPYHCSCDTPPPICEPNTAGTACVQACPIAGQECIPKKVRCHASGGIVQCSIVACECKDQNCHVDLTSTGQPYCVNKCPDPLETCALHGADTDNDGAEDEFECICDPLPPDPICRPNSQGTDCDPITCPDTGTGIVEKCMKKCVILDEATGAITLSDCDCVGPDDCHMVMAGPAPEGGNIAGAPTPPAGDCVAVEDPANPGTVKLPPDGCPYLSPDEYHQIVEGLPAGVTVQVGAIHKDFMCRTQQPGTPQFCSFTPTPDECDDAEPDNYSDGEKECHESTLELHLQQVGEPETAGPGYMAVKMMPIRMETHTGPRTPGMSPQEFETDMFRLQGALPIGDPDFDLLRIRGGTDFGMPSPGHTTLTKLPSGSWAVDSFFDIEYEIEYIGKPCPAGSIFCGRSGSTTGTIRMATKPYKCEGNCPPGTTCVETRTPISGTTQTKICCECEADNPPCEPNSTHTGCQAHVCPNTAEKCVPQVVKCPLGAPCEVAGCDCDDDCHVDLNAAGQPYCVNPCPDPADTCRLDGSDTDGDGVDDTFICICQPPVECEPNDIKSGCNPINCPTGPAGPEECKPKCVILDPQTGQATLETCDCVGENECHMLVSNGAGGAAGAVAGTPGGGGIPPECVVPDNGGGTVTLPPAGCDYLSPDQFHEIVNGLPAGTTIEVAAIHKDFACGPRNIQGVCNPPVPGVDCVDEGGGTLGGDSECSDSNLVLHMKGQMGANVAGPATYEAMKTVPVRFETHTAPRTPNDPVQSFDTDMFRLQGQLPPGDPDFDLLRITAGTGFGMPSPGHTTLTRMGAPGSSWAVDSFFDVFYEIEFVGKPGGPFGGMHGSTTGTIRMATKRFKCTRDCPVGSTCKEVRTTVAGGIRVCCECEPDVPQVCEVDLTTGRCTNAECDCFGECIGAGYCDDPACCLNPTDYPNNCLCYAENAQESLKRCPGCFGSCQGGSYCDDLTLSSDCWVDSGGAACYSPNHHYSIYLCGDCFGECINGSYCDHPNQNCCLDPGNCKCWAPEHPNSLKMCGQGAQCRPKCVKYDSATGQVTATDCDCIGDQCFVQIGGQPTPNTAGPGGPCEVVDNGSGSVDLPPAGCDYLSPDEVHKIIDGLPAGTEIHLAPIHKDFICNKQPPLGTCAFPDPDFDCKEEGGTLGGEQECSNSTLQFQLTGTGTLAGWNRMVTIPNVMFETHTGKKKPFEPVQSFPTDLRSLQGLISNPSAGDPDFDLLRITAGSAFNLPSPGHTTLTKLPGGPNWAVDSFFDIEYRIDFVGAPGGRLAGRSGSTTATIRMATTPAFKCTNTCPPGQACVQTTTQLRSCVGGTNPGTPCTTNAECFGGGTCNPNGAMNICCDCVDAQVCEPKLDKKSCTNNTCPPGVVCKPKKIRCYPPPRGCEIEECECLDGNPCHPEMPTGAATEPTCDGTCPPPPPPNQKCVRNKKKVPGQNGVFDYTCKCLPKPKADSSLPGLNRHLAVQYAGAGPAVTAGPGVLLATRVISIDLQHVAPANVPQNPGPNFTTYDTEMNGACVGGTHNGHHCDTDADCRVCSSGFRGHAVCTQNLDCGACNSASSNPGDPCTGPANCPGGACNAGTCPPSGGVCSGLTGCTAVNEQNGCARWAGEPGTFLEYSDLPLIGNYRAARLQCTPYFHDWSMETTVNISGAEILPSSEYAVQFVDIDCADTLDEECFSEVLEMGTGRFGDIVAPFRPPALTVQPDGSDITQLVNKFRNQPGAPVKAISQLRPNAVEPLEDVSGSDITQCVDAFRQFPYRFSGPCPCPSPAVCGALACPSSATVCQNSLLPGLGDDATCVKTCIGGVNVGDPCIKNAHCPGGTCGNPFCRDRCGRCTPP